MFLSLLAVGGHRQVVKRNVVGGRELVEVPMVGDDRGNLNGQRADPIAVQEVVEAVTELGNHQYDALFYRQIVDGPLHGELFTGGIEGLLQGSERDWPRTIETHPHEEALRLI